MHPGSRLGRWSLIGGLKSRVGYLSPARHILPAPLPCIIEGACGSTCGRGVESGGSVTPGWLGAGSVARAGDRRDRDGLVLAAPDTYVLFPCLLRAFLLRPFAVRACLGCYLMRPLTCVTSETMES